MTWYDIPNIPASNKSKSYRLALNVDSMIPFEYVATTTYEVIFLLMPFDFQIMHSYNRIADEKRIRIRKGAEKVALLQESVSNWRHSVVAKP
jgi:hypothetical protein